MWEYKPIEIIGIWESINTWPQYWLTEDKLIPWIHYPNPTNTTNTPKIWQFSFTTTWNINITWIWFTPKLVMFQVTIWSRSGCWQMTTTTQNAISYADWTTTSYCIYIRDWWGTLSWRWTYVSMNSDWFTVNIDYASGTTVYVNYTCFW